MGRKGRRSQAEGTACAEPLKGRWPGPRWQPTLVGWNIAFQVVRQEANKAEMDHIMVPSAHKSFIKTPAQ